MIFFTVSDSSIYLVGALKPGLHRIEEAVMFLDVGVDLLRQILQHGHLLRLRKPSFESHLLREHVELIVILLLLHLHGRQPRLLTPAEPLQSQITHSHHQTHSATHTSTAAPRVRLRRHSFESSSSSVCSASPYNRGTSLGGKD